MHLLEPALALRAWVLVQAVLGKATGLVLGKAAGLVLGKATGLVLGKATGLLLGKATGLVLPRWCKQRVRFRCASGSNSRQPPCETTLLLQAAATCWNEAHCLSVGVVAVTP